MTSGTPGTDSGAAPLPDDLLGAARRAAVDRLAAVAGERPEDGVPTCPGWTVGRVAVHTGRIHRWVAAALGAPPGVDVPPATRPASDANLGDWLREGSAQLDEAFAAAGPHGAVRAPGWERSASWWQRRTCHETTVHAWDVQAATGGPDPLPTRLAIDGIDELLDVLLPGAVDLEAFAEPATIHLHTTDEGPRDGAGGEWLTTVGPTDVHTERRHARGDVALRGNAADLLLWLWGRVPTSTLDVVGDPSVAERLRSAVRL